MDYAIGKRVNRQFLLRSKALQICTMQYLFFTDLDEQTNGK